MILGALLDVGLPLDDLRRAAHQAGMTSLSESAWALAAEGITSIAEVGRVAGSDGGT